MYCVAEACLSPMVRFVYHCIFQLTNDRLKDECTRNSTWFRHEAQLKFRADRNAYRTR